MSFEIVRVFSNRVETQRRRHTLVFLFGHDGLTFELPPNFPFSHPLVVQRIGSRWLFPVSLNKDRPLSLEMDLPAPKLVGELVVVALKAVKQQGQRGFSSCSLSVGIKKKNTDRSAQPRSASVNGYSH